MYQIILIIENGGNVTPTRCCFDEERERESKRVFVEEYNAVNYNTFSPHKMDLQYFHRT